MKIKAYLETQADRLEGVLAYHHAPARVNGGTVGPRVIRFYLEPAPQVRVGAIKALADDLALALRVTSLRVNQGERGLVIEFPNPQPGPVGLLELQKEVGALPLTTALLGVNTDGQPLMARFSSPEIGHALISGTTGSGKSSLLRTMAVSLMLNAPAGALGFVVIDPKGRTFPPAFTCAHLLRPVVTDTKETVELLYSLLKLMELRDRNRENAPRVICVIDELADLVFTGGTTVTDPLTRLLQRGREAGIHIIAATQRPSAAILSGLMRANFPLRLVGKVVSPEDARIAAGCGGSGAERLTGLGDFIAVAGGQIRRFQAAYISTADTEAAVKQLQAGAAFVLPQGVPQGQGDISEDEIKTLTERLKPWWRQHGEEWGAKTGALRYLFGEDVPVGGSYWRMLEQALKHLGA